MSAVADARNGTAALLSARDVSKRFGATQALSGVDIDIKEREIHLVAGPTGSGKSTLLNVMSGFHRYDGGSIVFRGFPINLRSRRDAGRVGIAVVSQEAAIMPDLSVYENVVLPSLSRGRVLQDDLRERVAGLLSAFDREGTLDLDDKAHRLTTSQARLVAIARALVGRAKLYLFDEPFASLGSREIEGLIAVMTKLRMSGCGILVASRRLDDGLLFADQVTVLAEGRSVLSAAPKAEGAIDRLRRAIGEGQGIAVRRPAPARPAASAPRLLVCGLAAPPDLCEANLSMKAGEIVALHGLRGAGCAALIRAIAGLRPWTGGAVDLAGASLISGDVRGALRAGAAFAGPSHALTLPHETGGANLAFIESRATNPPIWTQDELCALLQLDHDRLDTPVDGLPVGVRQRVAIACALLAGSRAVLLDDPTRDLAPAERTAVHGALRAAAARGCIVLTACPDRDEALAVADRCIVLREGRTVADLPTALIGTEGLTLMAQPQGALARATALLTTLTRENGGAAFWGVLAQDHLLCLAAAFADPGADPGLRAGRLLPVDQTRIPLALRRMTEDFLTEPEGGLTSLIVPIHTRRGRPTGCVGLVLGPDAIHPPAPAVAFQIESLTATL